MKKIHLSIVTGASRGLGLALAEALIDVRHHLLCISRNAQRSLQQRATERGATLEQWTLDLEQSSNAAEHLESWLTAFDARQLASATLINNAATLPRIGPLSDAGNADLTRALPGRAGGADAPLRRLPARQPGQAGAHRLIDGSCLGHNALGPGDCAQVLSLVMEGGVFNTLARSDSIITRGV